VRACSFDVVVVVEVVWKCTSHAGPHLARAPSRRIVAPTCDIPPTTHASSYIVAPSWGSSSTLRLELCTRLTFAGHLYNPVLAHPSLILLSESLSHLVAAAADLLPLRRLLTVIPHLARAMRAVSTHLSVASLHQQRRSFARCRSRCAVHRAPRASRYPSWDAVCTETSHLRRCPIVRAYSGAYHRSRRTLSLSKRLASPDARRPYACTSSLCPLACLGLVF
jgi:hypothetical protein